MILNLIILSIACCIDFFLFLALSLVLVDDHDTDYPAKLSFLYPNYKSLNKPVILTLKSVPTIWLIPQSFSLTYLWIFNYKFHLELGSAS